MVQNYVFPATVSEAVTVLSTNRGKARIIAGGTDLMLELQDGKNTCDVLVDLTQIAELKNITEENGFIRIGASVTHAQAAKSELVLKHAPALAQACRKVGSLQIRNMGTIIGNIVTGNPAADAAVALACLETTAEITTQEGMQTMPLEDMYAGVCLSCIDSCCQVVTHVRFPVKQKGQGSAYLRMEQRKALALPMLAVSAMVELDGDTFKWGRILIAPVGAGPQHAVDAEEFLKGAPVTSATMTEAGQMARNQALFRSSAIRGSKEYRIGVLPVFVERVLQAAVEDARNA
ncbi:MAG: molybdopterin dehydrogenase [Deltaproteobacteria bacterium HGW-Deltaproteobacteria-18]|jgi:carbon-monoxide dehydrogenase medium subunit|nr:MAG: molybdopterin dehydrogenase [Deltaproteobacteria bacterium HGW-Deltaproteobacteria-18]